MVFSGHPVRVDISSLSVSVTQSLDISAFCSAVRLKTVIHTRLRLWGTPNRRGDNCHTCKCNPNSDSIDPTTSRLEGPPPFGWWAKLATFSIRQTCRGARRFFKYPTIPPKTDPVLSVPLATQFLFVSDLLCGFRGEMSWQGKPAAMDFTSGTSLALPSKKHQACFSDNQRHRQTMPGSPYVRREWTLFSWGQFHRKTCEKTCLRRWSEAMPSSRSHDRLGLECPSHCKLNQSLALTKYPEDTSWKRQFRPASLSLPKPWKVQCISVVQSPTYWISQRHHSACTLESLEAPVAVPLLSNCSDAGGCPMQVDSNVQWNGFGNVCK